MTSRKPIYFFWIELEPVDGYTYKKFYSRLNKAKDIGVLQEHVYYVRLHGVRTRMQKAELLVVCYDPRSLKIRLSTLSHHNPTNIVLRQMQFKPIL